MLYFNLEKIFGRRANCRAKSLIYKASVDARATGSLLKPAPLRGFGVSRGVFSTSLSTGFVDTIKKSFESSHLAGSAIVRQLNSGVGNVDCFCEQAKLGPPNMLARQHWTNVQLRLSSSCPCPC
ncbi:MAG TPA: hypothetical protein VNT33_15305, partial [Telluria sp.]|nr:hypothetical protein [Telluria sp.]